MMKPAAILCIDDEPKGLTVRKMLLESRRYEVLTATSGREGLAIFAGHRVPAVVLDYAMPEMNGERSSLSRSRRSCSSSFLVRPEPWAEPSVSSMLRRRRIESEIVCQLVSVPPSQR